MNVLQAIKIQITQEGWKLMVHVPMNIENPRTTRQG